MQCNDVAVSVPHDTTLLKYTAPDPANTALVSRSYPPSEKLAARAVSSKIKTRTNGLAEGTVARVASGATCSHAAGVTRLPLR